MRVVTTRYWWKRRHNVRGLIGWSAQNEISLYGYITAVRPWEMTPRHRFSITRWLNPDRDVFCVDDEPMPRYSEFLEFPMEVWDSILHPWKDEPVNPIEEFHTRKDRKKYLVKMLDSLYDRNPFRKVSVMYLPFGGLPIIFTEDEHGKVTIY